ncbi:general stress protein [Parafrigoribacterium humi]|uniref:general stress protein n=1 Tax=Parafrigoribacterium humi TaxID=3144664 RepID=UPI0032ED976F
MSGQNPFQRRGPVFPTLPRGDVLGTYDTYVEAQSVVDRLARAEFPVKQVSIVGSELKTVERVTGKLTYGRAAGAGAASGVWFGLFIGLVLFIFSPVPNAVVYVGAAALIGAGFGMLFGIVSYALNRRRRDFTSTHQVLASKYEIIVDPSLVMRAQELLARPEPEA